MVVALVVVGPKDLPKIMRTLGRWTGQLRAMAEQFRKNFDDMARESDLEELRQQVAALKDERPLADLHDAGIVESRTGAGRKEVSAAPFASREVRARHLPQRGRIKDSCERRTLSSPLGEVFSRSETEGA